MFMQRAQATKNEVLTATRMIYQVMAELIDKKFTMLNPLVTKYLQINSIFYSKSLSLFTNVMNMDPNRAIGERP